MFSAAPQGMQPEPASRMGPAWRTDSDRAVTVRFPFSAACSSAPCCVPPRWPLI